MSLKLGERFFKNSIGDFYYDEETEEVTITVYLSNGIVIHEWRGSISHFINEYTDAISEVVKKYQSSCQTVKENVS